ncbi:MAG: rRNA maturation RNase YbeY [Spirochaetia bacterium]|nr:rRNA maturation RNase YbeY [Spirochaetota bacterium]MDW8112269.1 rRNA maturation RNase YbeY [Spirochaetia bacterium]
MIKVNVIDNYKSRFISIKTLKKITTFTLEKMNRDNVELSVVLCDDETIREYNRNYRNKDYATDVLSFPDGDIVGRYIYLGDIIISIDRVFAQSKEFGVEPIEEFVRLLVHGILHLLGYDHETSEDDEKVMMSIQDNLITDVMNLLKRKDS